MFYDWKSCFTGAKQFTFPICSAINVANFTYFRFIYSYYIKLIKCRFANYSCRGVQAPTSRDYFFPTFRSLSFTERRSIVDNISNNSFLIDKIKIHVNIRSRRSSYIVTYTFRAVHPATISTPHAYTPVSWSRIYRFARCYVRAFRSRSGRVFAWQIDQNTNRV